jgi:steroid delta-isomerase-like uncharacterized protein
MKTAQTGIFLILTILLVTGVSNGQSAHHIKGNNKNKEVNMSVNQKNKEIIQKLYDQSLNKKNLALLPDLVSEEYTGIQGEKGVPAFEKPVLALFTAFPDIQWKLEELFGEGDKVVVRWKWQGTHTGTFQQFPATGKTISNDGLAIYELKNGKIINAQVHTDRLGFLQQMEIVPADIALLINKKSSKDHLQFIDKFLVPANAKQEFMERMKINRDFIKKLPGFIEDAVYERTDEQKNLICITIAIWKDEESIKKAKEAVQAEYKKQGFDPVAMFERLKITIDRGIYKEAGN